MAVLGVLADSVGLAGGSELLRKDLSQAAYRVPVDVVWWRGRAIVANSRSGTLSAVRLDSASGDGRAVVSSPVAAVEAEWVVADSISGLAVAADCLLVLDDKNHRVLTVQDQDSLSSENRLQNSSHSSSRHSLVDSSASLSLLAGSALEVPAKPVGISVAPNGTMFAVSSLWAHTVTIAELNSERRAQRVRKVELSFAPRELLFLNDRLLVIADAFEGQLVVTDVTTGQLVGGREINGHNIRGLSLNADKSALLVSHQTLNPEAFTTYEEVFWGVVMRNGLQSIPLHSLLKVRHSPLNSALDIQAVKSDGNTEKPVFDHSNIYPLGTPSTGSGDPSQILITDHGAEYVLLSGVDQVAYRASAGLPFSRLKTGRSPIAACLADGQSVMLVVNRFDDSLSVFDLSQQRHDAVQTLPLGLRRELTLAELGEADFYDARLSLDGWYSCHSCHTDGHTNSLLSDTLGDEGQGAPKKVLSLLGAAESGPWAWNGSKASLAEQIQASLLVSMQAQQDVDQLPVDALVAYVKTLQAPPGITAARGGLTDATKLERGRLMFESAGCADCHAGWALTSDGVYDVGLRDEMGTREFNPPSLRGLSQRRRFFHDGRAETLRDVLLSGHHSQGEALTDDQVVVLETFLKSL